MKVKFSDTSALLLSVLPGVLLASEGVDLGDDWTVSEDICAGYAKCDYGSEAIEATKGEF